MSEKAMWDWLCKKMKGAEWKGRRIENCSVKGFPDTLQKRHGFHSKFVELKDWSGAKKHPLTVEQYNFLLDFGGWVMVKTDKKTFYMVSWVEDLEPLMRSDIRHAINEGYKFDMSNFNPNEYLRML